MFVSAVCFVISVLRTVAFKRDHPFEYPRTPSPKMDRIDACD